MNSVSYVQNMEKAKKKAKSNIPLGGVLGVVGVIGFVLAVTINMGSMFVGFFGAISGGFLFGGFTMISIGLKILKSDKLDIISATEKGVTISTGLDTRIDIEWSDITQISSQEKFIKIMISDPQKYTQRLSKKEKQTAKTYEKTCKTPSVVLVSNCDTSLNEMVSELNRIMVIYKVHA